MAKIAYITSGKVGIHSFTHNEINELLKDHNIVLCLTQLNKGPYMPEKEWETIVASKKKIILPLFKNIFYSTLSFIKLFEKAKKLESKIEGAEAEVERVRKKLAEAGNVEVKANIPKKINSTGKEWFERFKWFRTSEGFLAISGRSARQNEELMRKYLMPDDLVFHADIHGSPFTILHKGRKAGEQSIIEAAQFTAAHSSAWKKGIAVDVYSVLPYQVSNSVKRFLQILFGVGV